MTDQFLGTPVAFVYVTDRERALGFYRDAMGLALKSTDGFGDWLDMKGALLRITVIADHKPHAHPVVGWQVDDIAAAARALRERGVTFAVYEGWDQDELGIWTSPDDGSRLAFFSDPDGNALMLSQD